MRRGDLIAEPALHAAFVRVNGEWYLTRLVAAHTAHLEYITSVQQSALMPGDSVELSAAISAARQAVLAYARWIVAHVDETKPETLAWASKALAPIDALREQKRQQAAKAEAKPAEAETTEPKKEEAKKETEKASDVVVAPIAPPSAAPVAQPAPTVAPVLSPPPAPAATTPTATG